MVQSVSARQPTQVFVAILHAGKRVPAQSAGETQPTHLFVEVSQAGKRGFVQSVLVAQVRPKRGAAHTPSVHRGVGAAQPVLAVQVLIGVGIQRFVVVSQVGKAAFVQSLSATQLTQVFVTGLQAGRRGIVQSDLERQVIPPAGVVHTPSVHIVVGAVQPVLSVQVLTGVGIQIFVAVSQVGKAAFVQSLSARQLTHLLVEVLQFGKRGSIQSELLRQVSPRAGATQIPLEQIDVGALHPELFVQVLIVAKPQVFVVVEHSGKSALVQSVFERQATQVFVVVLQFGSRGFEQSPFFTQLMPGFNATHVPDTHKGVAPLQPALFAQAGIEGGITFVAVVVAED